MKPISISFHPSSSIFHCKCFHLLDTIKLMKWHLSLKLMNLKDIYSRNTHKLASIQMWSCPLAIIWVQIQIWLLIPILMLSSIWLLKVVSNFPIFLPLWIHQTEQMHKDNKHWYHLIYTGREYNQQKLKTENKSIKLIQSVDWNENQPTEIDRTQTEKSQTQGCNAWS